MSCENEAGKYEGCMTCTEVKQGRRFTHLARVAFDRDVDRTFFCWAYMNDFGLPYLSWMWEQIRCQVATGSGVIEMLIRRRDVNDS